MTRKRAEKRDTRFCVLRVKCLSQNLTFSLGFHLRLSADSAGGKIVPLITQNFAEPPVPDFISISYLLYLVEIKIRALKSVSMEFYLRLSADSAGGKMVPQNTQSFAEPSVPDLFLFLIFYISLKVKIRALKSVSLEFHLRLSADSAGGKIVPQNTQNFAEPPVPDFISISYLLYLIERKHPSLKVC